MIELVDTHCHIHFRDYELDPEEVIVAAQKDGVTRLLVVGCTLTDSEDGVQFAQKHDNIWSSIGLHPHEAKEYVNNDHALQQFHALASKPKVVAIGETGLDYYYTHSSKEDQLKLLRFQLSVAQERNLPLIFHVRDAFDDFWPVLDEFKGIRGVVHSFTGTKADLDHILQRDLYVGLNGIMTFTRNPAQLEMATAVPLQKLLLETDAPFLTPTPFRGTICQPKHVVVTAEFLANLRKDSLEHLAQTTSQNATELFGIK